MTTIHLEEIGRQDYPLGEESDSSNWSDEHRKAIIKHQSGFGQRGQTPDHRVQPHEWRHQPFIQPTTTPWRVPLSPDQMPLLLLGFVPVANRSWNAEQSFRPGAKLLLHIIMSGSRQAGNEANEDKWFVYADGPNSTGEVRLHMHNSWGGHELIELCIDAGFDGYGRAGTGASITSMTWESSPGMGWKDASAGLYKAVARTVCSWVLNVELGPALDGTEQDMEAQTGGEPTWIEPTVATLVAAINNLPRVSSTLHRTN
jgi:hypothetical protein